MAQAKRTTVTGHVITAIGFGSIFWGLFPIGRIYQRRYFVKRRDYFMIFLDVLEILRHFRQPQVTYIDLIPNLESRKRLRGVAEVFKKHRMQDLKNELNGTHEIPLIHKRVIDPMVDMYNRFPPLSNMRLKEWNRLWWIAGPLKTDLVSITQAWEKARKSPNSVLPPPYSGAARFASKCLRADTTFWEWRITGRLRE